MVSYSARIMNIQAVEDDMPTGCGEVAAYKYGHQHARHDAAEIASEADATVADLLQALVDLDKFGADSGGYAKGSPLDKAWKRARAAIAKATGA